jgi:uncharacterized protein YjdB
MKSSKIITYFLIFILAFNLNPSARSVKAANTGEKFIKLNQKVELDSGYYFINVPESGKLETDSKDYFLLEQGPNNDKVGYLVNEYKMRVEPGVYRFYNWNKQTISINFTPEPRSSFEQEKNNTFDTANNIDTNIMYIGNFNSSEQHYDMFGGNFYYESSDNDYFHFYLTEPKSVYINLNYIANQYSSSPIYDQPYVQLYSEDAKRNTAKVTEFKCFKNSTTSRKLRLPSGSYYVVIKPDDSNATDSSYIKDDYNFKVITEASTSGEYEIGNNNDISSANLIKVNTDYTGNISSSTDVDYYKIIVPTQGKVKLLLQTPRQTTDRLFRAELYSEYGNGGLDKKDTLYSSTNPVVFGKELSVSPGTYYIKMELGNSYVQSTVDYTIQLLFSEVALTNSISLICTSENLYVGDTARIIATLNPSNSSTGIIWKSSDSNVVSVDQNGNIFCKALGKAYITASATDGSNTTAQMLIQVKKKNTNTDITKIIIDNKGDNDLYVGDTTTLRAFFTPSNSETTLSWTSDNENVAIVDNNGTVDCLSEGSATITATALNGVKGTYIIVVKDDTRDLSGNNKLRKIMITRGKLTKKSKTSYVVTLLKDQDSTQITPVLEDDMATLYINNKEVSNINVTVSRKKSKAVIIKAVAENGDSKVYKIIVKRK